MRTKSIILFLTFTFLFSTILLSQEKTDKDKKKDTTTQVQKTKTEKSNEKLMCAVMTDMPAKKNINYTYKGKKYYFCCKGCLAKFKKEPEKYIKN
jgi:YHS domain-containing protein